MFQKNQKVLYKGNTVLTIVNPELQHGIIACANKDNEIEDHNPNDLVAICTKEQIVDAIISSIDIRGIDLEDYKSRILTSGVYETLCQLMHYPILEETPEEELVPITYGFIKSTCGWSKFCDVTGANHYAINDRGDYDENHIFKVKKEQLSQLR